ncbi:MAG: hypothetical protein LBH82_01350 [Bacteroidales bacterium]|nr:hypothetical protein [Bacteroidales bacterium]
METNELDTILKEMLSKESAPPVKLDMETQRTMKKIAQKKESRFVTFLSILSIILLTAEMFFIFPQITIDSFKIAFLLLNTDIFILLVFLLIINNINRKELHYEC